MCCIFPMFSLPRSMLSVTNDIRKNLSGRSGSLVEGALRRLDDRQRLSSLEFWTHEFAFAGKAEATNYMYLSNYHSQFAVHGQWIGEYVLEECLHKSTTIEHE